MCVQRHYMILYIDARSYIILIHVENVYLLIIFVSLCDMRITQNEKQISRNKYGRILPTYVYNMWCRCERVTVKRRIWVSTFLPIPLHRRHVQTNFFTNGLF